MIHLDTSFAIRALVAGTAPSRSLDAWLAAGTAVAMSTVAWSELLCGPLTSTQRQLVTLVVGERLPFTEDDAARAAELFNLAGRRRGSLADCMIAATALRCGARLATTNPRDFARFAPSGLALATD